MKIFVGLKENHFTLFYNVFCKGDSMRHMAYKKNVCLSNIAKEGQWDDFFNHSSTTSTLYVNPTDRHQFLHYTSSHPDHTKRSIVFSQVQRVSRICSEKADFLKHLEKMKSWFLVGGYPKDLIESEMKKVKFT